MAYKYKAGDDVKVRDVPSVRNDVRLKPFIGKTVKIKRVIKGLEWPYYIDDYNEFSARELEAAPMKKKKFKKKGK